MKKFYTAACLVGLLIAGAETKAGAQDRSGKIVLTLKAQAEVTGRVIRLGDVARVEGGAPGRAAALRGLSLGRAPDPGYTRYLAADQVTARLRAAGVEPGAASMQGAAGVLVRVKSLLLDGQVLADAGRRFLEEALARVPGEHRIAVNEAPSGVLVPAGLRPPVIRPAWRGAPVTAGTAWVELTVEVDGAAFTRVPLSFTIRAFEEVLVAARDIEKGEAFDEGNTRIERVETTAVRGRIARDLRELAYLEARRPIPAGTVIRKEDGYLPPLVLKGREVLVVVRKRGLTIRARGIARQNGTLGETVEVRNPDSGNTFRGVVSGAGRVEIKL